MFTSAIKRKVDTENSKKNLILVKGKRSVKVRLVECSLNTITCHLGDSVILDLGRVIYIWQVGE